MKKSFLAIFAIACLFTSCADSFLAREPQGSMVTQTQYDKLSSDKLESSLNGLYSMIYTMNTSRHDEFGQRSIDLWGDILCADIAVTDKTYGWLYTDEQMQTTSRTGTIWGFYYDMLRNANIVIRNINEASGDIMAKVAKSGYPSTAAKGTYSINDTDYALYLAQALAMRGYCYANLVRWYTPVETSSYMTGYDIKTYPCCPLYTEANFESPQPLATSHAVYTQIFKDLGNSVKLFEEFAPLYKDLNGSEYTRGELKLKVDVDVARGLAAYAYLNAAPYYATFGEDQPLYQKAHDYAAAVMANGKYKIIKNENLTTTGFNSITDASWMWGQKVVTETSGGLKSWFGQVDIHSYSYAWAGDTKVIDDNLKQEISKLEWDGRINWFNDGSILAKFKDCPDGKFFSAASPKSTEDDDIDREWLSDNVLMRYESMFLIAAEASYFLNKPNDAVNYLKAILDERLNPNYPDSEDDYKTYINGLSGTAILDAITYNWRVEMWGEGYGLQTFRRLTKETKRGANHDYQAGATIKASDPNYNLNIPTSEATYNPNIK